jgi:hypothetical protein
MAACHFGGQPVGFNGRSPAALAVPPPRSRSDPDVRSNCKEGRLPPPLRLGASSQSGAARTSTDGGEPEGEHPPRREDGALAVKMRDLAYCGNALSRLETTEMISATRVLAAVSLSVAVLTVSSASAGDQYAARGDSGSLGLDAEASSPRPQVQTPRPIRTADRCTASCGFIYRRCQDYGNRPSYCRRRYQACMNGC